MSQGVGKTSLVEYLACKINQKDVPPNLSNKQVLQLQINKLLSNTKYRGEFEARMSDILEIGINSNYIFFIDEIHIILRAGNSEGGISAANLLKPYLLNPNLMFIGATTIEEYNEIAKDKALCRRFHSIYLSDFDIDTMLSTSRKLAAPLEKYHDIKLTDDIIHQIINMLNGKLFQNRYFPDKFIDFIDFMGSFYSHRGMINIDLVKKCMDIYINSSYIIKSN